ncbi:hypothetical protein BC827DRAFT_1235188 [Russula dissimulans]|nr:hypothetical protein BC827DRAFT_1235188 [Russula dissimulans]
MPWLKKSNSTRQQGDGSPRPPPPPPISSSQSYGGAPQLSPSPIYPSVPSGSGSAQSPYPPRDGFFQQPGNYAQQGGIRYPGHGGAPFLGGFHLPGSTLPPNVITGTGSATYSNPFVSQVPQGAPPDLVRDEAYTWFLTVDQDGNGQLSHEELRSALLNDRGLPFSNSSVKYLMSIFDWDGNGSISFEEFARLWKFVIRWRELFVEFDVDRDGSIDAEELSYALAQHKYAALQPFGFPLLTCALFSCPVGRPVVDLLLKKYGSRTPRHHGQGIPRTHMPMDWFICACIVVEKMWKLYDKMGDRPRISRDEFLEEVISLP